MSSFLENIERIKLISTNALLPTSVDRFPPRSSNFSLWIALGTMIGFVSLKAAFQILPVSQIWFIFMI